MTCVTTAAAGMGGVTCVPLQQGNVSTSLFFRCLYVYSIIHVQHTTLPHAVWTGRSTTSEQKGHWRSERWRPVAGGRNDAKERA